MSVYQVRVGVALDDMIVISPTYVGMYVCMYIYTYIYTYLLVIWYGINGALSQLHTYVHICTV